MHKVFTPPLADADECRAVLRAGSRSFDWASVLLPRRVRRPATALYAFCRVADDAIDGEQQAIPALRDLRRRVDCMYAGRPAANPIDRELARVVREYDLPRVLLDAMLEGFAWDVQQRSYADLREVHAYSARVAGSVGAMMAVFMGARSYPQLARACDLGVAMQLTNIARDVGTDARAGRLYLPQNWLVQAGVDVPQLLHDPQFSPALEPVIRRLLRAADRLYKRADAGIASLPLDCRPGIYAARLIYSRIGDQLLAVGCDSVSQRTVVSPLAKAALVWRSWLPMSHRPDDFTQPPLEANRFLVCAGADTQADHTPELPPAWWQWSAQLVRILSVFERLERREREGLGDRRAA